VSRLHVLKRLVSLGDGSFGGSGNSKLERVFTGL
jgi:hypothetical protein